MKTAILTDADTKKEVLIIFGDTGVTMAKLNSDDAGDYTELYDNKGVIIVSVLETPTAILTRMS